MAHRGDSTDLQTRIVLVCGMVFLMWLIELADLIAFRGGLDAWGIEPRSLVGLRGILFAPLLHGGLGHIIANSMPLLLLGWLVTLRGGEYFLLVTIIVTLASGLGTWLFGRPGIHIGASGVVFGYLGYLLGRGYFERSFGAVAVAVLVGMLYGGLLFGVLPSGPGVSWEGHLFGLVGGVWIARMLSRSPTARAAQGVL